MVMIEHTETVFRRFVDKWVTPTTITMLFGAIVWGLNLTWNQQELIKGNATVQADVKYLYKEVAKLRLTTGELTLLLDQISQRVERMHQADLEHFKDSEVWKRQIEKNTTLIENGNHRHGTN